MAQNYIYVGDTQYESTETWAFPINGTSWGPTIEITIGKDNAKGLLMLQTEVPPGSYIGGNVYLFLSDGSKITCLDKNVKDNVDNKSIAIYKFTAEEILKLKEYHIAKIRFTIQPSSYEGFNGTKTADNRNLYFSSSASGDYRETDRAVIELFD